MIRRIFISFIAFITITIWSYGQTTADVNFLQNDVPKEQVYLHVNNTLLFSGEKLLYKFYCLNTRTNKLSELSKIGWVILLNSDKEEVFKHKLKIEEGSAYSDFFIPSHLPSGAYKIIGYTSWMLNADDNYFEQDIHIINPYRNETKGFILEPNAEILTQKRQTETSSESQINLNKNSFKNREEVVLTLKNFNELAGNFSISVSRIDDFNKPARIKSTNFNEHYSKIIWNFSDTLILPEVRGSLITGKISGRDNSKNLIISFQGEESQLNIVSVDQNGEFSFNIEYGLVVDEVLFQLVDHKKNDFYVELYEAMKPDFSLMKFKKPVVHSRYKDYILEKSINNQIENAYSATKADQPIFPPEKGYFFNSELNIFNLDDYTRFPDVIQTFVEIIESGRIKKNADGTHNVFVRNQNITGEFKLPALLIIDGVVVQDHQKFISFDAERIQRIGVLRSKLFFGPEIYQGVVVVDTKAGDFPAEFREEYIKSTGFIPVEIQKNYYSPDYKIENLGRIPDYRYQLWWKPEVNFEKNQDSLRFFTSDLDGRYEINLEGFTNEGKPLSASKIFEVE